MKLYKEIKKCFPVLISEFEKGEIIKFMSCDYSELVKQNKKLDLRIKSSVLTQDSEIYKEFIKSKILYTSEMSNLIMSLFFVFLNSKLDDFNDKTN